MRSRVRWPSLTQSAYTTFAPELQKQQIEREGGFAQQHPESVEQINANSTTSQPHAETYPPNQTIISNSESIGKSVKEAVQDVTNEQAAQKSWPGLSLFKASFGGASSPKTPESQGEATGKGSKPAIGADKP